MKVVDLKAQYETSNQDIKFSIIIGNGQIGTSVVKLNDEIVAEGDVANITLGKGSAIKGAKVTCKTVVTDVNDQTNNMVVTFKFVGGHQDQEFTTKGVVDTDGDAIVFRALFDLT